MASDKSQLAGLTHEEMLTIAQTAPCVVRLTTGNQSKERDSGDCKTVQDLYQKASILHKDKREEEALGVTIYAHTILIKEVEKLARELMEKILNLTGEEESKVRDALVAVLDYQTDIHTKLDKDKKDLQSNEAKGNGYLLFRNLSDEEIRHFWNG